MSLDAVGQAERSSTAANKEFEFFLSSTARDAQFRADLLADPHGTLSKIVGPDAASKLPEQMTFVEPTADVMIVLPPLRASVAALDDAELEMVSGGNTEIIIELACALAYSFVGCFTDGFNRTYTN